jgi:hypothetical protein
MMNSKILTHEQISGRIFIIRGHRVMLDSDLAELYGVSTKRLNEQVRRNIRRFPEDFMFQLTNSEKEILRSQFATLKNLSRGGHRKYNPYVFTEQGVAMLSGVLKSDRAVDVNVAIMRAFVRLRQVLSAHKELSAKLDQLERKTEKHDEEIQAIFTAIRQLMKPVEPSRRKIGF